MGFRRALKKYRALMVAATAFIFVGCSSSTKDLNLNHKIKSGKDIVFYVATDVHYLSKDLTDGGEAFQNYVFSGDGKQLKYIDEIFTAFTDNIKKTKPDVLIISGDLTNNGEKKSHSDLSNKLRDIENSGTSVYVIPGNHDISNPWARGFKEDEQYVTDNIGQKDFSKIYGDFGFEEAISKDKDTLSYLAAPSEDVWLLMLDTNKYKDNSRMRSPQADGELSKNTLEWIESCASLAKENGAEIITVMHHNILNHSDVIQKGYTLNNNVETLKLFKESNLNLVLSGHVHIQDISSDRKDVTPLYDIVTGALSVNPHQYGILKYSQNDRSLTYSTSKVDVETWSKENGVVNKDLNNFKVYAQEYFGMFAHDMAYSELILDKNYSKDEVDLMSETMKTLNIRYFAGVENLNSKDIINSEGFKLWEDSELNFFKKYIFSILSDEDTDDNNLHIEK